MACCASEDLREQRRISQQIEKQLKKEIAKREFKLLLLGK